MTLKCIYIMSFVLMGFFSPFVYGQTSLIADVIDPAQQNPIVLYGNKDGVIGSPFFYDEFNRGAVKPVSGQWINKLKLKYNVLDKALIVKLDGKEPQQIMTTAIAEFLFYVPKEDKEYTFVKISSQGSSSFYQKIYGEEEGLILLLKHDKSMVKGQKSVGYNSSSDLVKDRVMNKKTYYLRNASGKLVKLDSFRKDLLEAMCAGDTRKKEQMERHRKERKLKLKTEAEAVALMRYYQSL